MINSFKKSKRLIFNYLPNVIKASMIKAVPRSYRCFEYKPEYVTLNVTDNCCFKCIMCNQWKTMTDGELSTQEWKSILRQQKTLGIKIVAICGGEPFLRSDIVEIISFARSLNLEVHIITNGYLLNDKLAAAAIEAGVGIFTVSVDAIGDDFDTIRGIPGAYKKVINTCEILSEYKKNGEISVNLYFTLMKRTLDVYKDVFALAKKFNFPFAVNLIDDTPYFFVGLRKKKDEFWINDEDMDALKNFQKFMIYQKKKDAFSVYHIYSEIDYFRNYFKDPLQKSMPCVISQKRLGIDSRGNVYGGCWSMGSFGNIKEASLEEIVRSESYKTVHEKMFFKQCPGCSCGYCKNVRTFFPTIIKELGYRLVPNLRHKIYK